MEKVSFITAETGDDLVLSFAVQCHNNPAEIESLMLMRTPKYEFILEEHERGVKVSCERDYTEEDDYLQKIAYDGAEAMVRIQTSSRDYELDVRKVGTEELKRMGEVLQRMNFDRKFETSGV